MEAVIALSIVFLARELAQTEENDRLSRATALAYGLRFRFAARLGFAGVLREIGLPEDALFTSLLLFNVGIELGQLFVVLVLVSVLWLAQGQRNP